MSRHYLSIGERLDQVVEENLDSICLYYQDKVYTFKLFNEIVNQYANFYYNHGVHKGDKVALLVPNNDICAINLVALIKLGAVPVPVNYNKISEGLKYILNHCDAKHLLLDVTFKENFAEIARNLEKLTSVFTINFSGKETIHNSQQQTFISVEKALPHQSVTLEFRYPQIDPLDTMEIIYTSGTTGPPKGVIWTHNKFDNTPAKTIGFTKADTMYICLPLFHGLAQTMFFMCLLEGASCVLSQKFSASRFWEDIQKYDANWFCYIGAMISILLKKQESSFDKDNAVQYCYGCGAPKDPKVWMEFEKRFNLQIIEYYGATEGGTVTTGTKPGSVGKVKTNYEVKILNEKGNECTKNAIGELLYRTKDPEDFFKGYYKNPEATKEKIQDGWLKSGDFVYQDEEGYLYFEGRKVESIRRKGENISPWEVESIINGHEAIKESAAVPVPSEVGEDEVKLCIVFKRGKKLSYTEIITYCVENMAHYLVPRYIELYDELPKTPTQKIERSKLKLRGITQKTWDRENSIYKEYEKR
ncbi:AMP-binding protein [Pseudalkalibacillus sp. A8]|uniref:AMP-binding protein n=1 Tax=Pseudalkalibacillus sp. A8 TaxID=3382641 RepID=UPI0038B5F210